MPSDKRRQAKNRIDRLQQRLPTPVRRVVRGLRHEDVMLLASSLSFYALVSIIPTVILVLWLAGLIAGHHQVQDFAETLANYAPKKLGIDKVARQIANLGGSLGAVAIVGMLWPSTAYGVGLLRAFDRMGHGGGQSHKGVRGRLKALSFVVFLPALIVGALLISYAMTRLIGGIQLNGFGYAGAFVITFLAACASIALIYRLFPPIALSWRAIWAGTVGTALAISILSGGYTVFINVGANFQTRYASSGVAAVVLLSVWLYLVNALVLAGYEASVEFQRDSA